MMIQTYEGKSITEWALACKELETQLQHCREERQKLTTEQVDAVNELIEPIQRTVQTRVDVRAAMNELTREQLEQRCRWLDGNAAYQLVLDQYAALRQQLQSCREELLAAAKAYDNGYKQGL